MIVEGSLSETVDAVAAVEWDGGKLPAAERLRVARWLAARQGLPGAYAGTFGGFRRELEEGIVVFTGERITSASARHILGEETSRALRSLGVADPAVRDALDRAGEGLMQCLERAARANPGTFCCGKCTVGLWRNLEAGNLDRGEERLSKGIGELRFRRTNDGEWQAYPFWYTVLALTGVDMPEARRELEYAASKLETAAGKRHVSTRSALRRQELARRALARV
ncbi:hypothetical protein EV646_101220 [Kribbella antiqua]|uniref:Uncharacterized protein n=1 Tax=Kribbella antiqua TaxID=2512217 RepID=A0A4R2J0H9_9ACTN|nr:hypothetical protein [Kribbella antiqua]TCO51237.1 hypothetical protein EV646_101220 [Kribbella antiqua]